MSAAQIETVEGIVVPTSSDLQLVEAITIEEGAIQSDGSVVLNLIRPCVGKGRGKHLYKADMLEANAAKFSGWKMYLNHLSEAARRALGGLPRDVRDVGGIVSETWWDPDVPASGRFGAGAVRGAVKPIKLIRDLIDIDPRLVECSINATATGVQPGRVGQEKVWVVEGISNEPPGSVDWVTEAGAGGQVAALMESVYGEEDPVGAMLSSLPFDDLVALMEDSRPGIAEAASRRKSKPDTEPDDDKKEPGGGDKDDDAAEFAALVKKFVGNGMPRATAEKAAKRAMQGKDKPQESRHEGDEVAELTPEQIREALASEEGQASIALAVRTELQGLDLGGRVETLVEARLDEERSTNAAETEARLNRRAELMELRDYAHARIAETKLTPRLQESLRRRFNLVEGTPTPELNVLADVDSDGSVVKTAKEKLTEALTAQITEAREILREANPTRVIGQGPRELREGAEAEVDPETGKPREPSLDEKIGPRTAQLLREAGFKDPDKALAITPESVLARVGIGG